MKSKQGINKKTDKKKDCVLSADYPDPFIGGLRRRLNSSTTNKIATFKSIILKEEGRPSLSFREATV